MAIAICPDRNTRSAQIAIPICIANTEYTSLSSNLSNPSTYLETLIKHIGFLCSRSGIYVEALFVPREENVAADALTHRSLAQFTSLADIHPSRERDPGPTPLSEVLTLRSPSV